MALTSSSMSKHPNKFTIQVEYNVHNPKQKIGQQGQITIFFCLPQIWRRHGNKQNNMPNSTYQDTFSFLLLLVPVAGLEGEVDTLLLVFIAGLVFC